MDLDELGSTPHTPGAQVPLSTTKVVEFFFFFFLHQ